jgi:hypothetical protein
MQSGLRNPLPPTSKGLGPAHVATDPSSYGLNLLIGGWRTDRIVLSLYRGIMSGMVRTMRCVYVSCSPTNLTGVSRIDSPPSISYRRLGFAYC